MGQTNLSEVLQFEDHLHLWVKATGKLSLFAAIPHIHTYYKPISPFPTSPLENQERIEGELLNLAQLWINIKQEIKTCGSSGKLEGKTAQFQE